jgi:hypothetical protein
MVKPVILRQRNYVDQSTYQYDFPRGSVKFSDGDKVALAQLSIYYSFYNITSANQNNTFTYNWFDALHPYGTINAGNTYTVTFPDGFYHLDFPVSPTNTWNEYFQKAMIANNTYLIDAAGEYVFYFECIWNNSYYRAQIISYPIPTVLPVGWSLPPGATWTLPAAATCPVLNIPSTNNVPTLLGFPAGAYPPTNESTTYSALGTTETDFFPVSSVIVGCNLLKNLYSTPATNLYTIPISNSSFGFPIEVNLGEYAYVDLQAGIFDSFTISFYDQNYNPLVLNDKDVIVYLLFDTKAALNI